MVYGRARAESNSGHWARHALLHMVTECVNHSATRAGEGVGHFARKFQVDRDVACNPSMDRYIEEWYSYNFDSGSFHTNKLCSRLISTELEFYWQKQVLCHALDLGVTYTRHLRTDLSMACWKACGRLPISANWTYFASSHGWGAMSGYYCRCQNTSLCAIPWHCLRLAVLTQYRCVTDRQTHMNTHTQTHDDG